MVAQTNHQITKYAAKIKLTRWFVFEWGKPTRQKPYRVILRSQLLRIHYYHNKLLQVKEFQYLIPTYSWILTPNAQLDLFCSDNLSFSMHGSQYVTNQFDAQISVRGLLTNLRKMLAKKFFSSSTRWRSRNILVTKPYDIQIQQLLE